MSAGGTFTTVEPDFAQLRKLTEVSRALTYTTSLDQVRRLTVERGAELLDAGAAVLMLTDAGGLLHVLATHGIAEERVRRFEAPLDDEVIGRLQGLLDVPEDRFIAVPLIVAGVRLATVSTIGLVTVTSILGDSFGGLGFFILEGYRRSFPTELYAGAVLSILLALAVDVALARVQRRLTPWRAAAAAGAG